MAEETIYNPTGDEEIDRVRREVCERPTDEANYGERVDVIRSWSRLLQRQGADMAAYAAVQDQPISSDDESDFEAVFDAVTRRFEVLEEIQSGTE